MADIKTSFLIALFATLLPFGQPQFTTYQQICQRTTNSKLCIQIIDASTSSRLKANVNGWLQILSDQAKRISLFTLTKIDDAAKNNPSPRLSRSLDECRVEYNEIIRGLEQLEWRNLDRGNYADFNKALGYDELSVSACTNDFSQDPPIQSPVIIYTQNTKDLLDLTLEVLNLNQCNKITACI